MTMLGRSPPKVLSVLRQLSLAARRLSTTTGDPSLEVVRDGDSEEAEDAPYGRPRHH